MRNFFRNRKPIRLQTWIMLLIVSVLMIALTITGLLIGNETAQKTRESQREKAMNIASAVSQTQSVIDGLVNLDSSGEIQSYTKAVQEDTDVDYIVVMDNQHIRRSHPVEERIGQYFVGNDEDRAFQGERYTSVAEGTLGKSMRAFTPVWNEGEQIGVVAVGILLNNVEDTVFASQIIVYIGIAAGLVAGAIGAVLLARRVKRILHGLEPSDIVQLLQERDAMLASVREGIIAINKHAEIVVANHAAMDLFRRAGLAENPIGKQVDAYLPPSDLTQVLLDQNIEFDQEQKLNGIDIIVNTKPVIVNDHIAGIIATFRDRSELTSLVKQLTDTRTYADTLRAQTHEFMNKLHVMSAMVHTESYKELEEYIGYISDNYHKEIGAVSRLVKDPVLAGYLHNKLSQFRENGVVVELNGDRQLPLLKNTKKMEAIITMIGNLSDNANEAVAQQADRRVLITINYINGQFHFTIQDNGPGLTPSEKEAIFEKGRSTKGKTRGYGLFLTMQALKVLDGTLEVSSEKGEGTVFDVIIPYEGGNV
ncbi:two-component system sensor histidine kinase DcuS [Lentibacillus populi]|uniref:histidine kinase n=1 Tax=Lentibacillus populi TaxID=1827502 RepID=A0A9W5TY72_9BACI|nr:DcuS/MalK family sensor histidine kinase [Lentibacillus populi]GGB44453.1 two-component system sensor histidine kinase DcuS [Lentibacillus populi]